MNLIKLIKEPQKIILFMMDRDLLRFLPDKTFIKAKYKLVNGNKLNIDNPHTYNEKLQWLKLYDRNIKYSVMVDKYEVKKYVGNIIGQNHIIPTIGIYDRFDDIDFNKLPKQFVIKCTHDSGGLVICKDKNSLNYNEIRKKFNKLLKRNYYSTHREWPYKNVKPRIIIEKYMEDEKNKSIRDYKFFCFHGKPTIMYVSEGLDNHKTASMSFFDMDFNLTSCKRKDYRLLTEEIKKPKTFDEMKKYSKLLSKGIPHVRVDFYEINGTVYFGELTFFTCSGMIPFEDEEWNKKLGDYIELPTK